MTGSILLLKLQIECEKFIYDFKNLTLNHRKITKRKYKQKYKIIPFKSVNLSLKRLIKIN